jgi:hypothetical protein
MYAYIQLLFITNLSLLKYESNIVWVKFSIKTCKFNSFLSVVLDSVTTVWLGTYDSYVYTFHAKFCTFISISHVPNMEFGDYRHGDSLYIRNTALLEYHTKTDSKVCLDKYALFKNLCKTYCYSHNPSTSKSYTNLQEVGFKKV